MPILLIYNRMCFVTGEIIRMLSVSGYFEKFADNAVFVSVHDAVIYSQDKIMHSRSRDEDIPEV